MSEQLKIKLSIANRVYPLTISPRQEEGLRLAAQKIDQTLKKFEQSYSVKDKQDVLAMCALQFAAQSEQTKLNKTSLNEALQQRLEDLDKRLEARLNDDIL
jgi:cell division protein ZapA|tara:strand:+ start:983 stop:1285 length:303 start_codon:yes stop_codon:yes gene_type:complete